MNGEVGDSERCDSECCKLCWKSAVTDADGVDSIHEHNGGYHTEEEACYSRKKREFFLRFFGGKMKEQSRWSD